MYNWAIRSHIEQEILKYNFFYFHGLYFKNLDILANSLSGSLKLFRFQFFFGANQPIITVPMVLSLAPLFLGKSFQQLNLMIEAEISCWDLSIFGFKNRRKSGQIVNDDIYLPISLLFILFYFLFILWPRWLEWSINYFADFVSACIFADFFHNSSKISLEN